MTGPGPVLMTTVPVPPPLDPKFPTPAGPPASRLPGPCRNPSAPKFTCVPPDPNFPTTVGPPASRLPGPCRSPAEPKFTCVPEFLLKTLTCRVLPVLPTCLIVGVCLVANVRGAPRPTECDILCMPPSERPPP